MMLYAGGMSIAYSSGVSPCGELWVRLLTRLQTRHWQLYRDEPPT